MRIVIVGVLAAAACAQPPQQPRQPSALEIAGRAVEASITVVSPKTLRIRVSPLDGNGSPAHAPDEPAIVSRDWPAPVFRLRTVTGAQTIKTGNFEIAVTPEPLRFVIRDARGAAVQNISVDKESAALRFSLGDGPVLGLGAGAPQFNRKGQKISMRASHGGDRILYGGRMPVPWLMGSPGWGIYINRPNGDIDLTGSEGQVAPGLPIDLFVAAADQPAGLMLEYANLTGHPTMPPLWTLGYQQSHRTVLNREAMFKIADTLREKRLPCDALIYLGTGFAPSGWNTQNGEFTFKPDVFPDPARDIKELQSKNFKIVLHVTGAPRRLSGTIADQQSASPDPNHAREYWMKHEPVRKLAVDGWWPDLHEELSDASRLARIRMYWEGDQADRPNRRPFALHRTGYAGMQRYGGWLWSGDINSTWEVLRAQVPVGINAGLSGVPYWGTDIGGFYASPEYTGELYIRWFQFGAFCPSFRAHGVPSYLHLPWSWNTGDYGPPEMRDRLKLPAESELRNPKIEPIAKKYLELRYRLLPYLYSAVRETHETGLPVIRALWLHYPEDPKAAAGSLEYLWGRDMLVAPVVERGAASRSLYLPKGAWIDFWKEEKIEGGREISREVDLETMPIYVRAGAIVPMGPVKQHTAEKVDGPITLNVYPGADGMFDLYEDDGITFDFQKGAFMKIRAEWRDASRELSLSLAPGSRNLGSRKFEVRIAGSKTARSLSFNGRPVRIRM